MLKNKIIDQYKFHSKQRPFIVALDGLSGSGKTTVAKQLETELKQLKLNVKVFHIDDHIVNREQRYNTGHDEWYEYFYLQWDVNFLKQELFKRLHQQSRLVLPFYNNSTDTSNTLEVELSSTDIVIIEGIFLQRVEWKAYFDFVIYIECPREVRFERALNRDTYIGDYQKRLAKYRRRYWPGEDYYIEKNQPATSADFLVNNY